MTKKIEIPPSLLEGIARAPDDGLDRRARLQAAAYRTRPQPPKSIAEQASQVARCYDALGREREVHAEFPRRDRGPCGVAKEDCDRAGGQARMWCTSSTGTVLRDWLNTLRA